MRRLTRPDVLALVFALAQFASTPSNASPPPAKISRVGILCAVSCATSDLNSFRAELAALGYREGSNIIFETRSAEGRLDRLVALADDLVRVRPDVIFTTWGTAAALAAKRATTDIPVVVGSAGDLVAAGLVASFSRPGANVTGVSSLALDLEGKRLDILKHLLPGISRVAVFWDPSNPYSRLAIEQERRAASQLGLRLHEIEIHNADQVDAGFATILREGLGGLSTTAYVPVLASRDRIIELAAKVRIPTIYPLRDFVTAGGLLSYGASLDQNARRAAVYVDRILNGAKPADLPVEQPTKVELVINLKTAQALGLTVPPAILARADEVIE